MASVTDHCPCYQSAQIYRHGQNPKGRDRFCCRDGHRVLCSFMPMKPASPASKNKLPTWHATEPVSGILQGRSKSALTPSFAR